jgi:hypothetical protein
MLAVVAAGLSACGTTASNSGGQRGESESGKTQAEAAGPAAAKLPAGGRGDTVTNRQWTDVWKKRADGFVGDPVEIVGRVYKGTGKSLFVYGGTHGRTHAAEVSGTYRGMKPNDYVLVKGSVSDTGASKTPATCSGQQVAIGIDGVSVSAIGRERALALAAGARESRAPRRGAGKGGGNKRELNLSRSSNGLRIEVKAVEWTGARTRVSITVSNRGSRSATVGASGTAIQQGPRVFRRAREDKGASALSGRIEPGATKRATLSFQKISRKRGKAYIGFEWRPVGKRSSAEVGFVMRWKR